MPTCTTACSGSCVAKANVECQVACQTDVYTECETELVKTCETQCEEDGGAIFCDGQFLNAGNAKSCASELKAKLDIDIDVDVDVEGEVEGAIDTTKDKAKSICSVANIGASGGGYGFALFGLAGSVLLYVRRRR